MWDAKNYYRHFDWAYAAMATHCRAWVNKDTAETLVDERMMFGCRAAASWGQRASGFMAWTVQQVMDRVLPQQEETRRAYEMLRDDSAREGYRCLYRCAFISSFLDDLPMVCVESVADTFQQVQAAVWERLGFQPQGEKCWWEGDFVQQ